MYTWQEPKQKPYAMYIHGFASSPKSGTRASLARALPEYEWLAPEVTHEPFESQEILNEWARTFEPDLIVGTSMGGKSITSLLLTPSKRRFSVCTRQNATLPMPCSKIRTQLRRLHWTIRHATLEGNPSKLRQRNAASNKHIC